MAKIPFDPARADPRAVRAILFERLRQRGGWRQLETHAQGFEPFIDYQGEGGADALLPHVCDAFWQLVNEGILHPGKDPSNPNLPWFRVTAYGQVVLRADQYQPHDPDGYLARLRESVTRPDATVMVYIAESLEAFRRGVLVAATVMLGVAAERVFLLLAESLLGGLADEDERRELEKRLNRFQMKPKLDWVHEKLQRIQDQRQRPRGFPDNTTVALTAIYDLLRKQRNELGHPHEDPPRLEREEVFTNLQLFPSLYETSGSARC